MMMQHLSKPPAASEPAASGIVTLTTDFGDADIYAAAIKGVLLSCAPRAVVVDVTHAIPAQDIRRGALALAQVWQTFPRGTVHMAVVDPGVGTDRGILAVQCGGHYFVAPDNGILWPVIQDAPDVRIHHVTNADLFRHPISATFHGRDIMAPVAAHLIRTVDLTRVGPRMDRQSVVALALPTAQVRSNVLHGEVMFADAFGNAVTNITQAQIVALSMEGARSIQCHLDGGLEFPLVNTYSEVSAGSPAAVIGSDGCMEIAVNCGHAAHQLGCDPGVGVRCIAVKK